ncbi:hypothetical protein LZ32DRAFT_383012 [Colletotrichum eremochloae]|nr:hypothetical protein LZ32DRAFT_383012 [Colletotrichum eremochloae]
MLHLFSPSHTRPNPLSTFLDPFSHLIHSLTITRRPSRVIDDNRSTSACLIYTPAHNYTYIVVFTLTPLHTKPLGS